MTLPIALSLPHAGLSIPEEVADLCQLTREQMVKDGDEGAAALYDLREEVGEYITTDVARAIVDLNRSKDDRSRDGVVKTHTIWNEPIYCRPLPEEVVDELLQRYYDPYHSRLANLSRSQFLFAVDCHTMAAQAPPIARDPGTSRPEVCLGNLHGRAFPAAWTTVLRQSFKEAFEGFSVTLNRPFAGGYITQRHYHELPWVQVEISRADFLPRAEIRSRVLQALRCTCEQIAGQPSEDSR